MWRLSLSETLSLPGDTFYSLATQGDRLFASRFRNRKSSPSSRQFNRWLRIFERNEESCPVTVANSPPRRTCPIMSKPFLTAKWHNLFLATYPVPPAMLQKRLPPGLALDLRDGNAFVSLVAFQFLRTRVLGIVGPATGTSPS